MYNVISGDARPPYTVDRIGVVTDRISLMTSIYDTDQHSQISSSEFDLTLGIKANSATIPTAIGLY